MNATVHCLDVCNKFNKVSKAAYKRAILSTAEPYFPLNTTFAKSIASTRIAVV